MALPHSPRDRNCKLFVRFTIVEATNSHITAALMDHTALRRDNFKCDVDIVNVTCVKIDHDQ